LLLSNGECPDKIAVLHIAGVGNRCTYMKLTSVKIRYQDADIESELNVCRNHFKEGVFQFSSNLPSNHIELRENKTSSFMESFYQRLAKILVSIILSILNSFFP